MSHAFFKVQLPLNLSISHFVAIGCQDIQNRDNEEGGLTIAHLRHAANDFLIEGDLFLIQVIS